MVNNNENSNERQSAGEKEYKCEVTGCWYSTNRAYNLYRHERSRHSGDVERQVHQCPLCIYSTNKATNLRRHLGTRHPSYDLEEAAQSSAGEKTSRLQCEFPGCKYVTNRSYDMRRHLSVHTNQEKEIRKYKCSLCLYSSDRKANLARHVEVRHGDMCSPVEEAVKEGMQIYDAQELEFQMLDDLIEEVEDDPTIIKLAETELETEPDVIETTEIVFEPVIESLKVPAPNANLQPVTKVDSSMIWQLPQVEGNLHEEVIAINVNGELRWFQAIEPPEGASLELQRAMQMPQQEPQIVHVNSENNLEQYYENLDDKVEYEVISLNRASDNFREEYFRDDNPEEEGEQHIYNIQMVDERQTRHTKPLLPQSTPMTRPKQETFVLTKKNVNSNDWTWDASSTSNLVDNTSRSNHDPKDSSKDIDDEFPDWWDDGVHTKAFQNTTFRTLYKRTSSANIQRILRLIFDLYYKPFKEKRKKFEIFQIKDSWLCATKMTRMQLIKDMYSKQGT